MTERRGSIELKKLIQDIKDDLINGLSIEQILKKYKLHYYRLGIYAEHFNDIKFKKKRGGKSVREIRNKLKS